MPNINGKFAEQNDIVLTGQVISSNNNQTALNAVLAETNQIRGTAVIFQSTGLLATPANPVPNVTSATQGTIGAALGGIGQADTPSVTPGGGGNPCFFANTPILMADMTQKPIASLTLGEWVKAFDSHGKLQDGRVIGLHQHIVNQTLEVTFADRRVTRTTSNHKYWTGVHFVPIFTLDKVMHWDGKEVKECKVTDKAMIESECIVFNITVDTFHSYIANGDLVSNLKPLPPDNFENQ